MNSFVWEERKIKTGQGVPNRFRDHFNYTERAIAMRSSAIFFAAAAVVMSSAFAFLKISNVVS